MRHEMNTRQSIKDHQYYPLSILLVKVFFFLRNYRANADK